jgi:hypothetical protein
MPSKKKSVAKKQTKSVFVMALDPKLTPKQVVAKGKTAGTALSEQHVRDIRWEAKRARKGRAAKTAPPKPKPKTIAVAGKAKRRVKQTKAEFVLAQDPTLSAARIVALARAAGFTLSPHRVHNIRWAAKHRAKASTTKKAAVPRPKSRLGRASRVSGRRGPPPARRVAAPMPKGGTGAIAGINPLDLAYAVGRLVAAGKATAAEIVQLAAERTARIVSLEGELAALKGGNVPVAAMATRPTATKPRKQLAKPAARAEAKRSTTLKGKVSTRRDGRSFTTTAKVVAARKWQGQYMGYLRQISETEKPRFRTLAKEQGIPAAVGELKKRLGKS